jgi:NADH-quinone oxidoreductase subunit E
VLTEQERQAIEEEIARSYDRQAACIGALSILQYGRGWISDEAIADLADLLGMTRDELDGVATFYSLVFRRPVGRHVLKVCDGAVCWMLGGQSLLEHLEQKLGVERGGTTADGRFTLLPICCLGDCDHAPVMMVDDQLVRNLTPEMLDRLIAGEEMPAR